MDFKPKSTLGHIKDFIEGIVYQDYLGELDIRLAESYELLLLPEEALKVDSLTGDMVKGRIRNLKEMKDIFDDIFKMIEAELEGIKIKREKENGS